ncbi:hypothetical protein BED46_023980 [Burkholderia contaminans]|uniref:hypothetical protein n=1 Tax=Burkholderia contaminans TaxID=488447 RepID=UPI000871DD67|nr:hypothetical protein [Burkholderia contaminans]OMI81215.1 hypothetical protein BED46_023980 [Burkholderia contaminans]
MVGEAVGAQVEFGVGERGVIEDDSDGIGRALDLLLEQAVQRLCGGVAEIRVGAVPLDVSSFRSASLDNGRRATAADASSARCVSRVR